MMLKLACLAILNTEALIKLLMVEAKVFLWSITDPRKLGAGRKIHIHVVIVGITSGINSIPLYVQISRKVLNKEQTAVNPQQLFFLPLCPKPHNTNSSN